MGNLFGAGEIVDTAVQIEKNGKVFYEIMATKAQSEKTKEIFIFLGDEEDKHIVAFQKLSETIEQYDAPESFPGEEAEYMKSLAAEHIFTQANKGKEVADKVQDDKEAIDLGIQFEKDSIVFYEAMKKAVREHEHKILDELITQEKDHLLKLSEIRKLI